jgi:hypothetical protein
MPDLSRIQTLNLDELYQRLPKAEAQVVCDQTIVLGYFRLDLKIHVGDPNLLIGRALAKHHRPVAVDQYPVL